MKSLRNPKHKRNQTVDLSTTYNDHYREKSYRK
jgi:hypothetical protein